MNANSLLFFRILFLLLLTRVLDILVSKISDSLKLVIPSYWIWIACFSIVVLLACFAYIDSQKELKENFTKTKQDRYRITLLNNVKNIWIDNILKSALSNVPLIELGLEEKDYAVQHPFNQVEEFLSKSGQKLAQDRSVTTIFNEMGAGRKLLILGEPGSGKTITLLRLAQYFIDHAEQDLSQPIPVVFNLSSWASKRQSIAQWLVQELYGKYYVSKDIGKAWVQEEQLLLLLDGFDEVKAEVRNDCIQELNKFIKEHGLTEIAVCSRIRDYEVLSNRLTLQSAICIQPLTQSQIDKYLDQAQETNLLP